MSKTWRRRPSGEDGPKRKSKRVRYERRHVQPSRLTVEWVIEHVSDRIDFVVRSLVETETIREDEAEDYASILRTEVIEKFGSYRDDIGVGETGPRGRALAQGSAVTYFRAVIHNKMVNLIREIERNGEVFGDMPIALLPDGEREGYGCRDERDVTFSDECRSVKEIDFRLDLNTLVGHLLPQEYRVFVLRLKDKTFRECASETGLSESKVRRLMKSVAQKAESLGFERPRPRRSQSFEKNSDAKS